MPSHYSSQEKWPPTPGQLLKFPPKMVDDDIFQTQLVMQGWQQVRQNENIDLLVWWQYLVKTGIKKLALDRSKELKRRVKARMRMH